MQPIIDLKIQYPDERIKALLYVKDFITKQQQKQLIKRIVQSEWNTSLKRRTQHYGFQYRYDRKNQINQALPIPQWANEVKTKIQLFLNKQIKDQQNKPIKFDQLIINQYQPGQGINPHTDNPHLFSSPIVSLSLGSECVMQFDNQKVISQQSIQLILKRRSIFVLDSQARYEWKHSIPSRKKDNGRLRTTRYSLTFRVMKLTSIQKQLHINKGQLDKKIANI